ncbi:DCC1-like thiol-disulfide oxidoreductase family protein [Vreelandella nanhaiensis]|uniref:DCC1-like thiol-disulfide oxidoreductase family protein n=1 Tax=Vreelandella nanhaiensis TaxID=1258546 RepID=UPI001FE42BC4|nr:DCC1-like thiol-disulfide oxidoreductase family protein [Halomonas nanhaiensis]
MGQLRLKDRNGQWYVGTDASRALYAILGYRRLVRLSCLPGLRRVMDAGYRFFARRRVRLGR